MIINHLTDCDSYKFSMLRVFVRKFSDIWAKYEFRCRTPGIYFTEEMIHEINKEIDHLCTLQFTEEELKYIGSLRWMKDAKGFIEFLRLFKLNRNYIKFTSKSALNGPGKHFGNDNGYIEYLKQQVGY